MVAFCVFFGVFLGAVLFLVLSRGQRGGHAGKGGEGSAGARRECVGRWVCLDSRGAREIRVRWDPVIAHYFLDGEVWVDDRELAGFLGAMEGVWIAARDEDTTAIRRALGLPEHSGEGVRG